MIPWLWYWAPQFHFPFGGDVAQRIEPDTTWFFQGIRPDAGDAGVEQEVFDVASYGRQLGWLTELALSQAGSSAVTPAQGRTAQRRLEEIQPKIEAVKRRHRGRATEHATQALEKLRQADPDALRAVLARFAAQEAAVAPNKALR